MDRIGGGGRHGRKGSRERCGVAAIWRQKDTDAGWQSVLDYVPKAGGADLNGPGYRYARRGRGKRAGGQPREMGENGECITSLSGRLGAYVGEDGELKTALLSGQRPA